MAEQLQNQDQAKNFYFEKLEAMSNKLTEMEQKLKEYEAKEQAEMDFKKAEEKAKQIVEEEEKRDLMREKKIDEIARKLADRMRNERRTASKISFPMDNLREGNMDEANFQLYQLIIQGSKKLMARYGHKVVWTGGVGSGAELVDSALGRRILEDKQELATVRRLFEVIDMPTKDYTLPIVNGDPTVEYALEKGDPSYASTAASDIGTAEVTFSAKKIRSRTELSYEEGEDAIVPVLPIIRRRIARAFANAEEKLFIRGDSSGSDPLLKAFDGITNTAGVGTLTLGADDDGSETNPGPLMALKDINKARALLGEWGWNPADLRWIVGLEFYLEYLINHDDMKHVDQVGESRATLITGHVGHVYGIPVHVSQGFAAPVAGSFNTSQQAILAHRDAVMIGDRRRLTINTEDHPADEYMDIVGSERLDLKVPFPEAVVVLTMYYKSN